MAKGRYFGGDSLRGSVHRLNAGSFKELIANYVNYPVKFKFTREEFNSWPEDVRNKRKECPYLCAAEFTEEGVERRDENAKSIVLVFLDIDDPDLARDLFENIGSIREHLRPHNFAVWTSAKHTPEKPRLKFMAEVEPCDPSNYRRLVNYFATLLGIPLDFKGVKESKVISQPQYRPVHFHKDKHTSVLDSRTDGIPIKVEDLPEDIGEDNEDTMRGRKFGYTQADRDRDGEGLGLFYLPLLDITLEDVAEILAAVNPDLNYIPWLKVAAALRHQFPDEEEAKKAYQIYLEWSKRGTKFRGEKEVYAKWKSFRPYARGRDPVTLRTLIHYAIEAGWDKTKLRKKVEKNVLEWIAECRDADELLVEGRKKIAAMPCSDDMLEDAIILKWRKRLVTLGMPLTQSKLKTYVRDERKAMMAKPEQIQEENFPNWVRPLVLIGDQHVIHNYLNGFELDHGAFDSFHAIELMPTPDKDQPLNGRPPVMPWEYCLNVLKIPRVNRAMFYPIHQGDDPIFEYKGQMYLNSYTTAGIPLPEPDFAEKAKKLWYKHLSAIIAEPELIELFTSWIAFIVQHPERKLRWGWLIQSAEGAGKGMMGLMFRAILGTNHVRGVSPEMLKSPYNDWAVNVLLLILEEIHMPGDIRERVTDTLKTIVSDDTISISQKYRDARCDVPNFASVIGFTNKTNAIHINDDSRRWAVVFSKIQSMRQAKALAESGHFRETAWLYSDEGAAALRFVLLTYRIPADFNPDGPAPMTPYRKFLVDESKHRIELEIEKVIEDNLDPLISHDAIFYPALQDRVPLDRRDAKQLNHFLLNMNYLPGPKIRINSRDSMGVVYLHRENWTSTADPEKIMNGRASLEDFDI